MTKRAWAAFLYLGTSIGSLMECNCACRRILTTSMGPTTRAASVAPAARPARKVDLPVSVPSADVKRCLYCSKDANLIAIFGTIPLMTAPRPLYRPKGVSLETIIFPVAKKPLGLAPGVLDALRLSCMRTLMVSRGWHTHASARPARPPATKWMERGVFLAALLLEPLAGGALELLDVLADMANGQTTAVGSQEVTRM